MPKTNKAPLKPKKASRMTSPTRAAAPAKHVVRKRREKNNVVEHPVGVKRSRAKCRYQGTVRPDPEFPRADYDEMPEEQSRALC